MLCRSQKCRKEIADESIFCMYCGTKQQAERTKRKRPNGTGYAYKRGKTWTAVATLGWRPDDEIIHRDRVTKGGFATKTEALNSLPQLKLGGKSVLKSNPSFMQIYDAWEQVHEKSGVSDGTMACYRSAKAYYKPLFHSAFRDIGLEDLQTCVDDCPKGRRTRENMRSLISLMYQYALPRNLAAMNFAEYLNMGENSKKKWPALTMDHLEIIKESIGIVPYADYIYCLCYTGFRPNEMFQLTGEDYDRNSKAFIGGSKTDAGKDRVVPISPKILPIVEKRIAAASPYIFPREDGSMMKDAYFLKYCFYPAIETMGIQPVPKSDEKSKFATYSCRHTFSNLLKRVQGFDKEKAALMGHTDYEMTKYYQSAELEILQNIMNSI